VSVEISVSQLSGYANVRDVSRPNIGHSHASDAGSGTSEEAPSSSLLHAAANETNAATVHASAIERILIAVPPTRGIVHTRRAACRGSLAVVRVLLSALRCEKGALSDNLAEHRRVLRDARDAGCALALFPEMSLTGSVDPAVHPEWLLTLDDHSVSALVACTRELRVAAVFGVAERHPDGPFISQVVAAGGEIEGVQRKRRLGEGEEAFRVVDEDRVFEAGGVTFGIAICAEGRTDRPFAFAQAAGARMVCFPAAPGLDGRRTTEAEWRAGWDWWCGDALGDARRHARERGLWIAIATQAGSTADEDFPGLAALVDPQGVVVDQLPDWSAADLVVEVPAS
jgi:predicted amidohydrolase